MTKQILLVFLIIALLAPTLISCDNSNPEKTETTIEDTTVADPVTDDTTAEDTTVDDTVADDTTVDDTVADDTTASDTVADDTTAEDTTASEPIDENASLEPVLDENGVVSWNAIPGAVKYEYNFVDSEYRCDYSSSTTNTYVQLPEGYSLHVRPIFANGKEGSWITTEIYGDVANEEPVISNQISHEFSTAWEDLSSYDLIPNIKHETLKTESDGSIYFEAIGPKGNTLRFVGKDIKVEPSHITFKNTSKLVCLDSIGRICAYSCSAANAVENVSMGIDIAAAYSFSDNTSVSSIDELSVVSITGFSFDHYVDNMPATLNVLNHQPNFIALTGYTYSERDVEVNEITVHYDEKVYNTPIRDVFFYTDFYSAYLEGEKYDPSREVFDLESGDLSFYLIVVPDVLDRINEAPSETLAINTIASVFGIEDNMFKVGALKDSQGKTLNKESHQLKGGERLEVILGDSSFDIELPVLSYHKDANTMHDLVPYAFPEALGKLNVLVVPIVWQDEPEDASNEMLALYRSELGRVVDINGNVVDYSDQLSDSTRFSLSKYYDIASYGKLSLQSFITDWYRAPYDFAQMKDSAPSPDFTNEMLNWLYESYPDMDWSKFDRDKNGYFDAVVFINAGDMDGNGFNIISFGGGIMTRNVYTGELAGTPQRPTFNCYTTMNTHLLSSNTLIHEFAHNLGLVDYYDVTYSGIDAVGQFDMQSSSRGDWNPYSKYSVGWIEPEIVRGLQSDQSVEIDIGAFATTGDAIVIPGASSDYFGTPFSEYIMIDLFTDDGVNCFDSEKDGFDLKDAVGVRIYHINSLMEYRELTVDNDSKVYPIGTIHTANTYDLSGEGNYLIELIQASKDNTFTDTSNLRTTLSENDLFKKGDVFSADKYSEFFHNGLMADGTEFGYTVEIVNITSGENPVATIRITRK